MVSRGGASAHKCGARLRLALGPLQVRNKLRRSRGELAPGLWRVHTGFEVGGEFMTDSDGIETALWLCAPQLCDALAKPACDANCKVVGTGTDYHARPPGLSVHVPTTARTRRSCQHGY